MATKLAALCRVMEGNMGRRGSDLAARFKASIQTEKKTANDDATAQEARDSELRVARSELFEDLAAFAEALEIRFSRDDGALALHAKERSLRFEPVGEADEVRVVFSGSERGEHRLRLLSELDRWAWCFKRWGKEERLLFFDDGLLELCVLALGLARPGDGSPPQADGGGDGGSKTRTL